MLKQLVIVAAVVSLSACSTFSKKEQRNVNTDFLGGNIKVSYTMSGEFQSIAAAGSAKVTSNAPDAAEKAYIIATLRARQQMAEFMKLDLQSEKFKEGVYESLQESEEELKSSSTTLVKDKIASNLQTSIRQKANAILRGTYVESQEFDRGTSTVKVVVKSTPRDIDTAKNLTRLMGN